MTNNEKEQFRAFIQHELFKLVNRASEVLNDIDVEIGAIKCDIEEITKELIEKGKFEHVNENITEENFPAQPVRGKEYKLFHFNRLISSEKAMEEMKNEGYLPANIYELLSWDGWNGEDFVIGLGSVAEVGLDRGVPALWDGDDRRGLGLGWFGLDWSDDYRFLGVRNSHDSQALETQNSELSSSEPKTLEIPEITSKEVMPEEIKINGVMYKRV